MTPGPWRIGNYGAIVSDCPPNCKQRDGADEHWYGGHIICESVTDEYLHLITAAPELLEASREARAVLAGAIRSSNPGLDFDPSEHVTIKRLDAAIAKAEGQRR